MGLFLIRTINGIDNDDEMVVRAETPERAAAIYLTAAFRGDLPLDPEMIEPGNEDASGQISLTEMPALTGTVRNAGALDPVRMPVVADPDGGDAPLLEEPFPEEGTLLYVVRAVDIGGEEWAWVVEAGHAEEAVAAANMTEDLQDEEISRVSVQRLPAPDGPEGVLDWDQPLRVGLPPIGPGM